MNKKINPPKKSKGDYAHSLIKATAGAVPVAGSFLSEFVETIITPPYTKRQNEWMQEVANKMEELQEKVTSFKTESLKENDLFLDAMIIATKSAIATSSRDKRQQLLNAVQNVALNNENQNLIVNSIFLNLIDKFTDAHIVICKILESPNQFRATRGEFDTKETYRELINKALTHLDKDIVNIIVKELYDTRLIILGPLDIDNLPPLMQEGVPQITDLGRKFLEFISKPNLDAQ